jgi:uncharacterized membrane protein YesL
MKPDSALYRAMQTYGRMVSANLVWLALSLTVVAMPPATLALLTYLERVRQDQARVGLRDYLRDVWRCWRTSYALTLTFGVPALVTVAAAVAAWRGRVLLVLGAAIVVGFIIWMLFLTTVVVTALVQQDSHRIVAGIRGAILNPGRSVLLAVIVPLWVAVVVYVPHDVVLVPLSVAATAPAMIMLAVMKGAR